MNLGKTTKAAISEPPIGGELHLHAEDFRYIGVLFTGERSMKPEVDSWIGATKLWVRNERN